MRSKLTAIDFEETVNKMKAVDRYSGEDDAFVVFETDGATLVEVANPEPSACSLDTLKSTLLECPKRGKMCIALYKFNYPRAVGSSTLKGKSILMLAQDKAVMGDFLGGTFKATQVTMAVIPFVWKKLGPLLMSNSVSPASTLELTDSNVISHKLDGAVVWSNIKTSASRVDETEEESFIQHAKEQIQKAAGNVVRPTSQPDNQNEDEQVGTKPTQGPPGVSVPVSAVDTKKIAKEVEELLSSRIEEISKKIAREEVGMAIRKLGTDIGEATRSVGKLWIDKSRSVVN